MSNVSRHEMHLLRTSSLVTQLSRRAVSSEERAKYLLASFLVFNVVYYSGLAVSTAEPWSVPNGIEAVVVVLVNIIGVVKAFDASGGKDNPDFVAEFTCLYVPVSVTTVAAVWGAYWALRIGFHESILAFAQSNFRFATNLAALGTDLFGFLTFLANAGVLGVTYYRLSNLLAQVHEAKRAG
jgi:hypothetical protein